MYQYLIIYHREDNDGLFSMAIMYDYLTRVMNVPKEQIVLSGCNHNEISNISLDKQFFKTYENVIITDISFKAPQMEKLYKKLGNKLIWIDHHKPIIQEVNKLCMIEGSRSTTISAILNMWNWLYNPFNLDTHDEENGLPNPELLNILSAYDSWSFDIWGYDKEYVRNVNTGVHNAFNLDVETIIEYVSNYVQYINGTLPYKLKEDQQSDVIREFEIQGERYNKTEDLKRHKIVRENGSLFTVAGDHKACVIFETSGYGSNYFSEVKDEYRHGIIFRHLKDGNWALSLYNTHDEDEFHCGEYLKSKYGGGGHTGAAGCQLTEEQFLQVLTSKSL
jgi:oligoribonuclease NrnB/cAMP/cGMP phosphodiesterase (DHH superfamily)